MYNTYLNEIFGLDAEVGQRETRAVLQGGTESFGQGRLSSHRLPPELLD